MAITYPVDIPLEEFSDAEVSGVDLNNIQVSTFTGQARVQQFEGDYWLITLRYNNLDRELGRQVSAFVQSLRRSIGTFVVRFPGYRDPRGAAKDNPASPSVDGDGQAGSRVLNIKKSPADLLGWLLAGDIIQVGPDTRPHWHTVLTDVDTDVDGKASIDVWPAIRNGTVNNDQIVTTEPRGICRLLENPSIPIRPPVLYDVTLKCREAY